MPMLPQGVQPDQSGLASRVVRARFEAGGFAACIALAVARPYTDRHFYRLPNHNCSFCYSVGWLLALKEYAPRRPPSGEAPAGRRPPALRLFWSVIDWCQRCSFATRFAVSGFGTLGRAQAAEDPN